MRVWFLLSLGLTGCIIPKTTNPVPLDIVGDPNLAERVVVMLPGFGDRVDEFRRRGFLDPALRDDFFKDELWIAVDAHFGYYQNLELPDRIREDILDRYPDKRVTFVGISMGGFGANLMARFFAEKVDEVVMIAPYLGSAAMIRNRIAKGKLEPKPGDGLRMREVLLNWKYLIDNPYDHKITLIYGEQDRVNRLAPLMRKLAPHVRHLHGPGRHKWVDWVPLWECYLEETAYRDGDAD